MTTTRITTRKILTAINHPHLALVQGEGYWYFTYDDGGSLWESRSVMVLRLSHLDLAMWVREGEALIREVEAR